MLMVKYYNVFSQSSPPKQEKRGDSTTPVHQQAQKVDLPPTITIQPPNAGWDAMFFLQHPPIYFSQKEIKWIITLIILYIYIFFCSEDDDIFNDYGEEMDLRPLTQEELRSAIINKVTRKSTCQRLYIRHARSTRLQWGLKNLMFYSTINLQLVELQNFRKLFCSV